MSPGSFPMNGIPLFLSKSRIPPMTAIPIPRISRSFPMCCMGSFIIQKQNAPTMVGNEFVIGFAN